MSSVETIPDAVGILIQSARIAQEHGVYSLEEARVIADAIDFILTPSEKNDNTQNSNENPVQNDFFSEYEDNNETEETIGEEDDRPAQKYVDNTVPRKPTAADLAAKGKATSAPRAGVAK